MKRFVIRNYGPTRQIPYKGQQLCISNDGVIETDNEEEAKALETHKAICVTDRGSELAPSSSEEKPEDSVDEPEVESYGSMTVVELRAIAKSREMKTSGLDKTKLIEALVEYDEKPDEISWEVDNKVSVKFDDEPYEGVIKFINAEEKTAEIEFDDGDVQVIDFSELTQVEEKAELIA